MKGKNKAFTVVKAFLVFKIINTSLSVEVKES